jgi:hypothetical protein
MPLRIVPCKIQQRLARNRVAIGSRDRHHVAKAVSVCIECAAAALRPQVVLLALARHPVARALMKVGVVWLSTEPEKNRSWSFSVACPQRDRSPRCSARRSHPRHSAAWRESACFRSAASPYWPRRGHVILIVGQIVPGLQPAEGAQVIELVMRARQLQFLARSIEVARIAVKQQRRKAGCPVRRGQAHHAAGRIRAIQARIGPAINLRALHSRRRERSKVEASAQVAGITPSTRTLLKSNRRRAQTARSPRPSARTAPQTFPASAATRSPGRLAAPDQAAPAHWLPRWSAPAA